jgi:hypothetical protein
MKTFIGADINNLTLTYLEEGEVINVTFNTEQEYRDFVEEHTVTLLVSNARNYSELQDSEIVEQYIALRNSLNL